MEELKYKEIAPMSREEFSKYLDLNRTQRLIDDFEEGILHLNTYSSVGKYNSVRRAMKRGHVSLWGEEYPNKPFNNRANTCDRGHHSRTVNEIKKSIYGQFKSRKDQ